MINSAKLKGLMVEKGVSVNDLADVLGISRQAVSSKVNGKATITLTDAQTISKVLKMTKKDRDLIFFGDNVKCDTTK